MFAGAGLSQAVWDQLDRMPRPPSASACACITGLGMTETAPSCTFAVGTDVRSGHIGLPAPGVEVKLVPLDGKTEVRFRGPNVMPGYWRAPRADGRGLRRGRLLPHRRRGRAGSTPSDPQRGLLFDGRIAEDFKLSTGTFVSVGPLRAKIVLAGDPLRAGRGDHRPQPRRRSAR